MAQAAAAGRAELRADVSWIGNSFSGKEAWVLQDVEDIFVAPDGTLWTNVYWDEAGGNVQQYKDGRLVAMARHTHGWGYEGGAAVAANAKYLFIVQNVNNEGGGLRGHSWPAKGFTWSGISRRLRTDITKPAAFADGRGKEGDVLPGAFLPVVEVPDGKQGSLRGLGATDTRLFVSSPFDNAIKVYDTETMRPIKSWALERPGPLCLDRAGQVWVLQGPAAEGGAWKALSFTAEGSPRGASIAFPQGVLPTDLCADKDGRLLVADAGPAQQVLLYEGLDGAPKPAGTFGAKGGILADPPGKFGDRRFNRPHGVGTDDQGRVYVASSGSSALETGGGGSTVLECYAPDGQCLWRVFGLHFIDGADLDPDSDKDLYTKEEHFAMDWSRAAGQEWSYRGYTVNKFKYPDDPRLHIWSANPWVRRIAGQKFLFVTDMTAEFLQVFRFKPETDGEVAIPCALLAKRHVGDRGAWPPHQPFKGEWIWRDTNGNGAMDAGEYQSNGGKNAGGILWPDDRGNLWHAQGREVRCLPVQGLDARGVPVWDYAKAQVWPKPAEFDEMRRVHYLADREALLVGGTKGGDRNQHWKPMGPVLARYDGWMKGERKLRWKTVLPLERGSQGHESVEPMSFDVAGDFLFVAYTRGMKADGVKWADVKVYTLDDMAPVGNLVSDGPLGEIGLLDIVESVRAVKRPSGEYAVFLEDDFRAKVVLFRWRP